jgi:Methylase involved in ubiquinone/menaquinone biosynthesis
MIGRLCTVRQCRSSLTADGVRVVCAKGHSFDLARRGYLNLLQPQDRRSRQPGDSAAAVAARKRIHGAGLASQLLAAVGEELHASETDLVLDAGCGDGYFLGELQRSIGFAGEGLDISTPAIDMAARDYPECSWVVANADRFLPYPDRSFTRLMSITARMNAPEFQRVLRDDGQLLIAIPGPEDLIELRGEGRDRGERTRQEFASLFQLTARRLVTVQVEVSEQQVADLRLSIYRPRGSVPSRVTLSLDLLRFTPLGVTSQA